MRKLTISGSRYLLLVCFLLKPQCVPCKQMQLRRRTCSDETKKTSKSKEWLEVLLQRANFPLPWIQSILVLFSHKKKYFNRPSESWTKRSQSVARLIEFLLWYVKWEGSIKRRRGWHWNGRLESMREDKLEPLCGCVILAGGAPESQSSACRWIESLELCEWASTPRDSWVEQTSKSDQITPSHPFNEGDYRRQTSSTAALWI